MADHSTNGQRPHRVTAILELIGIASLALAVTGCSTPVGVKQVDIETAYSLQNENALSAQQPSEASKTLLRRHGLLDRFDSEPAAVLAALHADIKPTDDDDHLFALAELSFLHAERTRDKAYFLASAAYAWALLFPGDATGTRLLPSDPRFRLAYDLYNQAVAHGLAAPGGSEGELRLAAGDYKLPFGTLHVSLDESGLSWGGYRLEHFIPTTGLEVRGLRNRYRSPGLGAPLAASIAAGQGQAVGSKRLGPRVKVPVTALLRFEQARANLGNGQIQARLEVYAADQTSSVAVDGRPQPIESDPTAALAYQLNDSPIYDMEIAGFLRGGVFNQFPKDRANDGLFTMTPYKPGKIPIVLVHGTASSPARWAELFNELEGDPRIREHFQVWAFIYDSGNMIPYSAGRLRGALEAAVQEFDPESKDPALRRMVVIGHSQGGLLTKFTAVDTGTRFWDRVSSKPFDEIQVSPETRALLQRSVFFKPLPFVKRVVFIATPHHGAMLAAKEWVTGLAAKLVTLPTTVIGGLAQAATSSGDERLAAILRRPPTAIDNMNPNNPGLQILASTPVAPGVKAHSIIAVDGDGPKEDGDDGVVAYKSAHIDGVESEFVTRWNHSCQGQPDVIEEVRRILLKHLAEQ